MSAIRIMIIGGPGARKSWFALRLSRALDVALYCVDDALHDENGKLRNRVDIDRTVRSWASKRQWIIEGGVIPPFLEGFKSRPQAIMANCC